MSREDASAAQSDSSYTYAHRAFLQAFLTQNVMTADEIKPVLAAVLTAHNPERPREEGDITQQLITTTVQTVNGRIHAYDYEIRSTRDQRTKELTYALVNTTSDPVTQLATTFTANEIAYIRRVLDHMFETNNTHAREVMALKNTEAAQLARPSRRNRQSQFGADDAENPTPNDPGITIQEADNVLDQLVTQGFFQLSKKGYYSLAPRALMELRAYLKETYNDPPADNEGDDEDDDDQGTIRIRDCEGCREIVTYGIRCNDKECGVRWHDACANQYFRNQMSGGKRLCPKCKTECTGDVFVGERADQTRSAGRGRTSGFAAQEDEEDG